VSFCFVITRLLLGAALLSFRSSMSAVLALIERASQRSTVLNPNHAVAAQQSMHSGTEFSIGIHTVKRSLSAPFHFVALAIYLAAEMVPVAVL
jgi:hypothetical protein